MSNDDLYNHPYGVTQQFRHCGNPFRIDTYRGCNFGCTYCFAYNRASLEIKNQVANMKHIERLFERAFDENEDTKNLSVECLQHRVPLHLGGLADPFQTREFEYHCTLDLIKLTKKYNYPMIISTKTASLPEEYFEYLDPNIHAFQISLFSDNAELVRKYEHNTPTPQERIDFMKLLRSKGFWVSCRIQPLVDIDSAVSLVENISNFVNYITVEHLKISADNKKMANFLFKMNKYEPSDYICTGRSYELKTEIKKENVDKLKAVSKCPIGCGDNDLHEYSDSNNCCGIDTINENFNGWLKYNSMNIRKTNSRDYWCPKSKCHSCFNSDCVRKNFTYQDYVENYMENGVPQRKCNFKIEE